MAETPAIELIARLLAEYQTTEAGMPYSRSAARDDFVVGDEVILPHIAEDDGVLVISSRPHLAPGSALHRMLQLREIDGRHIALFGTRSWRSDERALASAKRIQSYTMIEISREGITEMTDAVMSYVRTWQRFHLILDISAADPVFAPGAHHPVPGGFTARELVYIVQRLRLIRSLGAVCVVVDAEPDPLTCGLAAHLIVELS